MASLMNPRADDRSSRLVVPVEEAAPELALERSR
jgi:hypothetical protein